MDDTLAMAFRINPAKPLVWRDSETAQIGLDGDALVLPSLSASEARLIDRWYRGVAEAAIDEVTELEKPRELLQRLSPVLLKNHESTKHLLSNEFVRSAFAEIIRASYLNDIDGIAVLEARAAKAISIDSIGPAGLLICLGLAASGLGSIFTEDTATISEQDIGPLAYPRSALGQSRISALSAILNDHPSGMRVEQFDRLTEAKGRHSIRVITGQNAMHPASYRKLRSKRIPHLAVMFGSSWVSVSPRILGGACLGCLDLHKTDADPLWPTLASQLVGRAEYLEDARSALFAASMAVGEIARAIDSPNQEAEFVGHRLHVASGRVEEWSWPRHSECDCG